MALDLDAFITKNFQWREFMHSEAAEKAGIAFPEPSEEIQANMRKVAEKAQEARDILQVKGMGVNNGWRPKPINTLVGGSDTSAHVEALAADLVPAGIALGAALAKLTEHATFMRDVDQLIIERGCLHLGLPCKASGYKARRQVRTETWTRSYRTGKDERHYPLLFVWSPKQG